MVSRIGLFALGLVGALALPAAASADVVSLNFENINASYPSGYAQILDYYNGGTSSDGTTGTQVWRLAGVKVF